MRVFKFLCDLDESGWHHFVGYFYKQNDSEVIFGYLEEHTDCALFTTNYVKGLYLEKEKQIVFLKMTNKNRLFPEVYSFSDLTKKGKCLHYRQDLSSKQDSLAEEFFETKQYVKISIQEISKNKIQIAEDIKDVYSQLLYGRINMDLTEHIYELKQFLVI